MLHGNFHDGALSMLLDKVYSERGWDFRNYKPTSLKRRVAKRLRALDVESLDEYTVFLDSDPMEYSRLFSTLTVKVSEFFRDLAAFDRLREAVREYIPGDRAVRAWCCGCACGEEAYSLAMLLADVLDRSNTPDIKVFATDIDPVSIEEARGAVYRAESIANVPPEMRKRHFFAADGGFKVNYDIRNLVRFGTLDIVRDHPISRVDILFCRNLFIYFNKTLQKSVFEKLDYSLRPGGIIVFGKAEVVPAAYAEGYTQLYSGTSILRKRP